MMVVLSK